MTMTIDGIEYLPAAEAAERLATTEMKILMLLRQKALEGEYLDGCWYVSSTSLSCYDPHAAKQNELDCRTSCSASGCSCR